MVFGQKSVTEEHCFVDVVNIIFVFLSFFILLGRSLSFPFVFISFPFSVPRSLLVVPVCFLFHFRFVNGGSQGP